MLLGSTWHPHKKVQQTSSQNKTKLKFNVNPSEFKNICYD